MPRRKDSIKILSKFVFLYTGLAVFLSIIFTGIFYFQFSQNALRTIQEDAKNTAISISESVDFTGHELLLEANQESSLVYKRIFKDLNFVSQIDRDVEYVYTMRPKTETYWEFVVDADIEEDENGNGIIDPNEANANIGELYDVQDLPELVDALNGATVDSAITTDIWGSWISGYAPIFSATGENIGIVGVDISAEKLIIEKRLVLKLTLVTLALTLVLAFVFFLIGYSLVQKEAMIITKELEIKNEDLVKLVKKRTKALEEFMAVVVHELRSPLTALRWNIELLLSNKKCTKAEKEQLNDMMNITKSSISLISNYLEVSKFNVGKFVIHRKKENLVDIVKMVIGQYESQALAKNINLKIEISGTPSKVMIDSGRIVQVISNLLSNAIKYTDKGSVLVKIKFVKADSRVRVEVIDTGIGIEKAQIKKLFKPYTRVGNSKQVGTGLGLSVIKSIVDAHNGKVGVISKSGFGSTFWFELPI